MTRFMLIVVMVTFTAAANAQFAAPAAEQPDGATLFKRQCGTCHSVVPGEARQGPNLAGIYGRKAGTLAGYTYSPGFKQADWAWDAEHLDRYLTNPQATIPGGVMAYRQANPEIRKSIIAYLQEQH